MTRSIPAWLAAVVEQLELDQPQIVTVDDIRAILAAINSTARASDVARRLRERGWLLPTGVRGVYEFAPGAHAGPVSRGDPFAIVRAAKAVTPELPVVVALGSAAWAYGLADRAPEVLEVSLPSRHHVPPGLRARARVSRFDPRLAPVQRKGVLVEALPTLLVHMASDPKAVRSWGDVREWLGELVAEAGEELILKEVVGRAESVRRRLGYLIQGAHPELSSQLRGASRTKVWFGPRGSLRRHDASWAIADTILPFDPAFVTPGGIRRDG